MYSLIQVLIHYTFLFLMFQERSSYVRVPDSRSSIVCSTCRCSTRRVIGDLFGDKMNELHTMDLVFGTHELPALKIVARDAISKVKDGQTFSLLKI